MLAEIKPLCSGQNGTSSYQQILMYFEATSVTSFFHNIAWTFFFVLLLFFRSIWTSFSFMIYILFSMRHLCSLPKVSWNAEAYSVGKFNHLIGQLTVMESLVSLLPNSQENIWWIIEEAFKSLWQALKTLRNNSQWRHPKIRRLTILVDYFTLHVSQLLQLSGVFASFAFVEPLTNIHVTFSSQNCSTDIDNE